MNQNRQQHEKGKYVVWAKLVKFHIFPFLGFVAVVLILNWPLVLNLSTHVIGRSFEDAFEVLWQLSWMETAVFSVHTNPFYAPVIYYPLGWYIASGAQPGWYLLLLSPLTHIIGEIATYNLVQLATFVSGGFGLYLLSYHLTRHRLASFTAGCAFIVAPAITIRQGGHLHTLISMQFLPFAVLFTYLAGQQNGKRQNGYWIILAGIFLALTILGMWYFLFIGTLPLMGSFILSGGKSSWRKRLKTALLIGGISLILISPFAYITWQAREKMFPKNGDFPLARSDSTSLSIDRLFLPNPLHPFWGEETTARFPVRGEQDIVAIGYATLVLAIFGFSKTPWHETRPFLLMGLIALILAMGTTLYWNGHRVIFHVPLATQNSNILYPELPLEPDQVAIPLPGLFLYYYLPFYASMRVWTRYVIPLMLVIALFVGWGSKRLLTSSSTGKQVIAFLFLGLILLEGLNAPYSDFTEVTVNNRSVNTWLAKQPSGTSIIEYPRRVVDKIAMYSQSLHGQQVVNGYMSVEPDFLQEAATQLGTWPHQETLPLLREWEIDYVLINGVQTDDAFQNDTLPAIKELDGLCFMGSFPNSFMYFNQTFVFAVTPEGQACN